MKSILVVAMDFPYPPGHGSAVDMWTRMLALKEMGYRIDLLATVNKMPNENLMQTVREHVGNLWIVLRRRALSSAYRSFLFRSAVEWTSSISSSIDNTALLSLNPSTSPPF